MADRTIYPFGTGGNLPSSIGVINDLVTGGADVALSAEQGKKLAGNVSVKETLVGNLELIEEINQDVVYYISLHQGVTYKITVTIGVDSADDLPTNYAVLKGRLVSGSYATISDTWYWKGTGKPTIFTKTFVITPSVDYAYLAITQKNTVKACSLTIDVEFVKNILNNNYVEKALGKNLCDPDDIRIDHHVLSVNGTYPYIRTDNANDNCTGYIPIKNGQTLVCNKEGSSTGNNNCALFANIGDYCVIEGTFKNTGARGAGFQTITNNLGYDAYAVFNIDPNATLTNLQVEVGEVPTDYEPYNPVGDYINEFTSLISSSLLGLSLIRSLLAYVKGINHRGYNVSAPENTMPAFIESVKHGFAYIETDIRFTSDGVAVLLHDASINRTARNADGTAISSTVNIADITYEQALTYDFGIWKSSVYGGTTIPTLNEFLVFCKKLGVHPYLELKAAPIQDIVNLVNACGMRGKVTYIGGSSYLEQVKLLDDHARLGIVTSTISESTINIANGLKTNYNEVFIDANTITAANITACKSAGIPLEIWSIDTEGGILALDSYLTGVTSDNIVASEILFNSVEI